MFHDKFTRDTQKLLDDYTNQRILLSIDIMESLKDWLVAHIMGHDKKFGEYMKKIKK
jgi:hemerythrin